MDVTATFSYKHLKHADFTIVIYQSSEFGRFDSVSQTAGQGHQPTLPNRRRRLGRRGASLCAWPRRQAASQPASQPASGGQAAAPRGRSDRLAGEEMTVIGRWRLCWGPKFLLPLTMCLVYMCVYIYVFTLTSSGIRFPLHGQ